jgi:ABC-2 type transport system ATP-binding protein
MATITIDGLTKRYGEVLAVDDLSFSLDSGTVTGFLGPNGAGKTTTLRVLLGLIKPTAGRALIDGRPYAEIVNPTTVIGAVLEASGFHPGRRARDHLRVQAAAMGLPDRRADEALDRVDLTGAARRRVGGFSLGMRQRLALAGALLGDPDVLILDEPANGLDPEGVHWLRGFVRHLASEGRTVLVSSHVLAEVAQTVDEVVIVTAGRLAAHSPIDDLTAVTAGSVRIRTPHARALHDHLATEGIASRLVAADVVVAEATDEAVGQSVARSGLPIYEMSADRTLEDAFLQLTATSAASSS